MKTFKTNIGGVDYLCEVANYTAANKPTLSGRFEDADVGSPAEIKYTLFTIDGKPANVKVSPDEEDNLIKEFEDRM